MAKTRIQPIAHKQVLKNLSAWEKESKVKTGRAYSSKHVEDYQKRLQPYLTKKGTVKKNLSQKKIKEFNALIKEIKKDPYSTSKKRKEFTKKQKDAKEKRYQTGLEHGTYNDRAHYETAMDYFEDTAVQRLLEKGYLDSSSVNQLADDYMELSESDMIDAFNYVLQTMDENIPDEIRERLTSDDAFNMIELYVNASQEGISLEDINYSLLAEMLNNNPLEQLDKLIYINNNSDYDISYINSIYELDNAIEEIDND